MITADGVEQAAALHCRRRRPHHHQRQRPIILGNGETTTTGCVLLSVSTHSARRDRSETFRSVHNAEAHNGMLIL